MSLTKYALLDFNQTTKLLDDAGIDYSLYYEYRGKGKDRKPHDIPLFKNVELKFEPHIWLGLCTYGGEHYVGGCCGATSVIQDKINHILRFDTDYISVRDLEWFAVMWTNHDGDDSYFSEEGWAKEFGECPGPYSDTNEPWTHMAWLWHVVKDHYNPDKPWKTGNHVSEIEGAVSLLQRTLLQISWEHSYNIDKEKTSQQNSNRVIALARMMPALDTFNKRFKELDHGPIDGFAIINPTIFTEDKEKSILRNGYGLCIYGSKEEAENLLTTWGKRDKELEEQRNIKPALNYEIKSIRVSSDKGIEWLEN